MIYVRILKKGSLICQRKSLKIFSLPIAVRDLQTQQCDAGHCNFCVPFFRSFFVLLWSSNDSKCLIVSSCHWFHSPRETMFEFEWNSIKPLAPVIYVSITMVKDGFRILTLRHLNNNRFYANQTEFKEKGKGEEGLRKENVLLSFVVSSFCARNWMKSFKRYFCRIDRLHLSIFYDF